MRTIRTNTTVTHRRGLTLPELLIASSITAMMLATLGTLAFSVDSGSQYSQGRSTATQHARVAIQRIQRNLNNAHASPEFPGFVAFPETIGAFSFPDLIVIWHPESTPANPDGLPLAEEVIVYCPNPANPAELWEITFPGNTAPVPALSDTSAWATAIDFAKNGEGPERSVITDLLRTGIVSDGGNTSTRGAIRFDVVRRPTDAQLQEYTDGTIAWNEVDWAQTVYSDTGGLRQVWCNVELQLMPSNWSAADDPNGVTTIPFFTSGAIYYEVKP